MKKKIFVSLFTVVLMVLSLFPSVSFAADYTLADGEWMNTDTLSSGDTITIEPGAKVSLYGNTLPLTNIRIICGAGVTLHMQSTVIDNSAYPGVCPLTFTGTGNTFSTAGVMSLTGGAGAPGISVPEGTELTIEYCQFTATGGANAAGIGGGDGQDGGKLSMRGGTLTAVGGSGGAGIGGGAGGAGGTVKFSRESYASGVTTVTATGNGGGAGIGGGAGGAGGSFELTGGTVTATGGDGAGIGGGSGGSGGNVTMSSGLLTANGTNGAGIGGGGGSSAGRGGSVKITGGMIIAGSTNGADIGGGYGTGAAAVNSAGGTLEMDNAAGVKLLKNGTNAAADIGTCAIGGAGAGSLGGAYFDGTPYTSAEMIDLTGTSSGTGYAYGSSALTILTNGEFLIWGVSYTNRVVVASGKDADIILFGTFIQTTSGTPFNITSAKADVTLVGTNTLTGGQSGAGMLCPLGATLTITGNGVLNAKGGATSGGFAGSGIGGGTNTPCGSITINGGTIIAKGGDNRKAIWGLPGIGGGVITITGGTVTAASYKGGYAIGNNSNSGSSITINGGTVTATGALGGYAIGGSGTGACDVRISGGTVHATGDLGYPAIGGTGGTIAISGGTVIADNINYGAGIGNTGQINISGGTVFAASGDPTRFKDIGDAADSTTGMLTISGTAKVFLKNNSAITPVTEHENETFAAGTSEVYGEAVSVPGGWTNGFGAWLPLCELTYGANGASGTTPAGEKWLTGKTVTLQGGDGLTKSGYVFDGWNTAADGSGTGSDAGESLTLTADTTLYAQWKELTLESTAPGGSTTDATIYTGGRFTLTPTVEGGVWEWDEEYFSATFTGAQKKAMYVSGAGTSATFTAIKVGASTITYTAGGVTASYNVTIEKSELPNTGQDFAWVWVLCGAALAALTAGIISGVRKRKKANMAL